MPGIYWQMFGVKLRLFSFVLKIYVPLRSRTDAGCSKRNSDRFHQIPRVTSISSLFFLRRAVSQRMRRNFQNAVEICIDWQSRHFSFWAKRYAVSKAVLFAPHSSVLSQPGGCGNISISILQHSWMHHVTAMIHRDRESPNRALIFKQLRAAWRPQYGLKSRRGRRRSGLALQTDALPAFSRCPVPASPWRVFQ